jgi:FMN phosphatase YigB (HAD superfamily)
MHLVKPDPRIFQRFSEKVALLPEQIIYIDDLLHNVEAARRIGMHAIRFSDPATLREELMQLGLFAIRAFNRAR